MPAKQEVEQEASSVKSSHREQAHSEHASASVLASPTAVVPVQSPAADTYLSSASGHSADSAPAQLQGLARAAAAQRGIFADSGATADPPRCHPIADQERRLSAEGASQQQVPEACASQKQTCRKPSRNSRRARKKLSSSAGACDSSGGCVVCWSAAACMIFQPCGHFCCCVICAQPFLAGDPCPVCRSPIAAAIAVDTAQSADGQE